MACKHKRELGRQLDAGEEALANYASHLSPARLLGAGIRIGAGAGVEAGGKADGVDPITALEVAKEDEDAIAELCDDLGCASDVARDALRRSCRWTPSGNPSRIKAAAWLRRELEEQDLERKRKSRNAIFALAAEQSGERGLRKPAHRDDDELGGGARRQRASSAPPATSREEQKAKSPAQNGNSVLKKRHSGGMGSGADSASSDESSSDFRSGGSSGSTSSSSNFGSSGGSSSSSSEDFAAGNRRAKERVGRSHSLPPRHREHANADGRHKSRYLRALQKGLFIDEAWAKATYDDCQRQCGDHKVKWQSLLEMFYDNEVRRAKGTQIDHARGLGGKSQKSRGGVNPTFTLPDWSSGQPPVGGVHFSTLTAMLEDYEKFERQTNYQTSVTFKSMIKDNLRAAFESKCRLPRTVWKNPRASDAERVRRGEAEEGGWSDLRFLAQVRRSLAPHGRTSYEIAFEKMRLYHRGTDSQLTVTLGIWGEKWLAKEREAEAERKTLSVQKMKILFKEAVRGVPKFKRWLEGRQFISSSDWYNVLTRKLHKSLGKTQEAEHDNRDYGDQDRGGGRGGWRGGRGFEGRGGGEARGGGESRGGGARGTPSGDYRGDHSHRRGGSGQQFSGAGAPQQTPYHFGAPPGRLNILSGAADDYEGYDAAAQQDYDDGRYGADYEHHCRSEWEVEEGEYGQFQMMQGHSGGAEPMTYSPGAAARGRGGFRGRRGGGEAGAARSPRRPINNPEEESREKLPKGKWWHDSSMAHCECRDVDCGTRQDVPYCQGCNMHGHSREFCFKGREPRFNATGYWCKNRGNEKCIEGLGGRAANFEQPVEPKSPARQLFAPPPSYARGNMMDATKGSDEERN